ncbi:MAG: glycoside hydrolase family 16 protein [Clostridia bacterium]|nr:glycoside hydrolase family 16 protein [Clostridia bacterium]
MKLVHDELIKHGYKLVFEDHFDGEELNPDVWTVVNMRQDGHNGHGAWRKTENLSLKDSNLTITARIEDDGEYTSGMINTSKSFCYKYGYAEIRAKLPIGGPGIWPGFWTKSDYPGAPVNSEIDIFEMFGNDRQIEAAMHAWWRDRNYDTVHHISYGVGNSKKRFDGDVTFSNEYHTIGYYWTKDFAEFSVDGEVYGHMDIGNCMFSAFHTPIYFIISMAFGLPFLPAPDEKRTEPIEYKIDYIRLYQDETGVLYDVDEERRIHERK